LLQQRVSASWLVVAGLALRVWLLNCVKDSAPSDDALVLGVELDPWPVFFSPERSGDVGIFGAAALAEPAPPPLLRLIAGPFRKTPAGFRLRALAPAVKDNSMPASMKRLPPAFRWIS